MISNARLPVLLPVILTLASKSVGDKPPSIHPLHSTTFLTTFLTALTTFLTALAAFLAAFLTALAAFLTALAAFLAVFLTALAHFFKKPRFRPSLDRRRKRALDFSKSTSFPNSKCTSTLSIDSRIPLTFTAT